MDDRAVKALAERLVKARAERAAIDFLGGANPPQNETDAYRIQFALHDLLKARGEERGGWKVAVPLPAQYQAIGLTGPAMGGLLKSRLVKSGARFPAGSILKPGIECEVAVRMAIDAPASAGPYTQANILPLVGAVMPAIEVVDNRYADLAGMMGPARIADDFLQHACVLGREITDYRSIDFTMITGRSIHNGKEIASGPGTAVMGNPIAALAWLANKLISLGRHLKEGDIVMTGSVHAPQFLAGGGEVEVGFDELGMVKASFA
ncbi:MAG: 2-keto-4-pentenoate hydratase [Reyranellaceae bacterium]